MSWFGDYLQRQHQGWFGGAVSHLLVYPVRFVRDKIASSTGVYDKTFSLLAVFTKTIDIGGHMRGEIEMDIPASSGTMLLETTGYFTGQYLVGSFIGSNIYQATGVYHGG